MSRVTGVRAILQNISKAKRVNLAALKKGLVKAGLHLQRASQQVVPVDTGALKNSAFTRVKGEGRGRKDLRVEVGYTMDYALVVHEDPDARHAAGKTYKYLERPAREQRQVLRQIIFSELKKANT